MLRVDWQGEADKARSDSLAIQAANRHEQQPELVSDLEQALNAGNDGEQAQASTPGQLFNQSLISLACVFLDQAHISLACVFLGYMYSLSSGEPSAPLQGNKCLLLSIES